LREGFTAGKELGLFVGIFESTGPTLGESVVPGVGTGDDKHVTPEFGHAVP